MNNTPSKTPLFRVLVAVAILAATQSSFGQSNTILENTDVLFRDGLLLSDQEEIRIPLTLPGIGPVDAVVKRFRVTDNATVFVAMTENGSEKYLPPNSVHLTGYIEPRIGSSSEVQLPLSVRSTSIVTLSLFDKWVVGRVVLDRTHLQVNSNHNNSFSISPLNSAPHSPIVIAPESSLVKPEPWLCSTDDSDAEPERSVGKGASTQAVNLKTIKIALEGDQPYYFDNASSVAQSTEYAEAVVAHASSIYQRDLNATLYIGQILIWTTVDPYTGTDASTLLTQFRNYWRTNHGAVDRDVAHLFSGVNNIGGVAYLNTLCSNQNGYSVSGLNSNIVYPRTTYAWDTDVISHEVGHNVGASHTHSCSWNPPIDSCYAAEGSCFSGTKATLGTIMSYCHLTTFGTQLVFHQRVADYLKFKLASWSCAATSTSIDVNAGTDASICIGSSESLNGSFTGGSGPYEIQWSPTTNMTGSTTLTPTVTPTQTTKYYLLIRDQYNAIGIDSVVITISPSVVTNLPAAANLCKGEITSITSQTTGGTQPMNFHWTGPSLDTNTQGSTIQFLVKDPGKLVVDVTDAKGCSAKDSVNIVVNEKPEVLINGPDEKVCRGGTALLTAIPSGGRTPYAYAWYKNGLNTSVANASYAFTIDSNVTFSVVVTDANSCTDTATFAVKTTSQQFAASPLQVELPDMSPCKDEVELFVTVTNTGLDSLIITKVSASTLSPSSRDIPFVLAPREAHIIPVLVDIPALATILDTLKFESEACKRVAMVVVSGERKTIGLAEDGPSRITAAHLECNAPTPRTVIGSLQNRTLFDVQIQKVNLRKINSARIEFKPSVIKKLATTDVTFDMSVNIPVGTHLDTLDVQYSSSGCTGVFSVPVALESIKRELGLEDTLNFGNIGANETQVIERFIRMAPAISPIPEVTVTSVSITSPFTTTLAAGLVLHDGIVHREFVQLDPAALNQSGVVFGELLIEFDSCSAKDRIVLTATKTTVDVSEEEQQDIGQGGMLIVTDLRGIEFLRTAIAVGQDWPIAKLEPGVYAAVFVANTGKAYRKLILK